MFDQRELEIISKALRYYERYAISDELLKDSTNFISDMAFITDIDVMADKVAQKRDELESKLESRIEEVTLLKAKVIKLKDKSIADSVDLTN